MNFKTAILSLFLGFNQFSIQANDNHCILVNIVTSCVAGSIVYAGIYTITKLYKRISPEKDLENYLDKLDKHIGFSEEFIQLAEEETKRLETQHRLVDQK